MTGTRKSGKEGRAKGAGKKTAAGTRPVKPGKQVPTVGKTHQRGTDHWRELVETSAAWIWQTDAAIRHTYTNAFVTRCLGYQPAEFLRLDTLDLVHPDDRELVKKLVQNAITRKDGWFNQILRWRHKDGSWRYIESSGSPLFDEQGTFLGLCGVDRDVTEEKRAAEELRRSEEKYRDLFENAIDAICITDRNQNYLDVNRRAIELFGYSREEFLSMNVRDMLPPGQLARSEKEFAKLTESGAYEKFTGQVRRKDGSYIDVEVSSSAIVEQGQVIGSRDIIRDITERRKAEESLRDSESRMRSIVESSPVGMHMYRLEPDGRLVFTGANPAADKILGVDNSVFIGKTIEEAFPPLKDTDVPQRYRDVARSGKSWQTDSIEYQNGAIKGAFEVHAFQTASNAMVAAFEDITERKRSEMALQQNEEKYRRLYNETPVLLHSIDRNGILVDVNDFWLKTMGYERSEVIGRKVTDFYTSASKKYATEVVQPAFFRDGIVKNISFQFVKKNGEVADMLLSATTERDAAGKVLRSLAVIEDITERKRAEARIRESEKKYRTLFESSNDGIFILALDGKFIDANPAAYAHLGYTREELLSMNIGALDTPEYADKVAGRLKHLREQGVAVFESANRRKDGSVMQIEVSARLLEYEGKPVIVSVNRDITERKQVEDALRESEERFRAITTTASDAILLMDDKGSIVYWNPAAERIFGYSADEAVGKDLHAFLAPHRMHDEYHKGFARFVMNGQGPVINRSVEMVAMKKNGTEFPIEVSTSAMNIGGKWHAVGIVRDVTERKQLEEERLKSQKLESIGALAGGIAHDFNNLLQGIFGYISMARLTIDQREKSLAMLEQAEKALHQSVNLTSQLLTFSKGGKPVKKVIDLRPVIEDSVKFALSGSRVSYGLSFGDDLCAVEADEGQLGQVVQNIVLNAEQSMPLGGRIEIAARNVPPFLTSGLPLTAPDGLVEIVVRDHGTGIPPEHLPRIFDPYFTTKEKGSGLGLATSYSIVKNHDGSISVASELGKGSTFTVYLPASRAAQEQAAASASAVPVAGRKGRVLVMDDEPVVRVVAGELLRELGHEAEFAEHGDSAVEKYRRAIAEGRPFDVVILDLTIRGGKGGAEALRELLEIDPGVKAVVSSGYSDDEVIATYRQHGFCSFLKKPYDIQELRRILDDVMA